MRLATKKLNPSDPAPTLATGSNFRNHCCPHVKTIAHQNMENT